MIPVLITTRHVQSHPHNKPHSTLVASRMDYQLQVPQDEAKPLPPKPKACPLWIALSFFLVLSLVMFVLVYIFGFHHRRDLPPAPPK